MVVVRLMGSSVGRRTAGIGRGRRAFQVTLETFSIDCAFPVHDEQPPGQVFDNRPSSRLRLKITAEAALGRACYLRVVRFASFLALSLILAACTETPSFFPPCVNPDTPCVEPEAGADASDASDGALPDARADAAPEDAGADAP